jgi:glycosyltransferase involved in cell wall biosynthesis
MLIGIDASRALSVHRTGTENYSLQLIRHLVARTDHHHFRLYCRRPPPLGLFDLNNRSPEASLEFRVLKFPRLWTHMRLSIEVTRHPPDVLFVPSHVLPVWHPRPSAVTVHDLGYRYFPEAHTRFDRWYLELSTRFNATAATALFADSMATKEDLVRFYGADPQRISVVYLGRDEALGPERDLERLAAIGTRLRLWLEDPPKPYILYVGTLQPRKNLVRLVDAFALLRARHPDLLLVLAGRRGWLDEPILRRVEVLGLQDSVLFPGYVADQDLPVLLSCAEFFAFPSLYEGFGLPVLEAQACGTPVLASNTSSLPEVAGGSALLVDPLDVPAMAGAMERLLSDTQLRQSLREAGLRNIQRFSWARCAEETLAVLEGCVTRDG